MVSVNCGAVVDIARRFLPAMKQRQRGAMIITSSIVGALPTPFFSVYAATKSFDLYLGEALHAECRGSGVDIVTVLPGLTRTEFHAGLGDREYHSPYRSAEQVVESALSALGRKSIVVDGLFNKLVVHGSRFLPRGVALWLSRLVMRIELGR
jgi:short-subunit dehydrogenase